MSQTGPRVGPATAQAANWRLAGAHEKQDDGSEAKAEGEFRRRCRQRACRLPPPVVLLSAPCYTVWCTKGYWYKYAITDHNEVVRSSVPSLQPGQCLPMCTYVAHLAWPTPQPSTGRSSSCR